MVATRSGKKLQGEPHKPSGEETKRKVGNQAAKDTRKRAAVDGQEPKKGAKKQGHQNSAAVEKPRQENEHDSSLKTKLDALISKYGTTPLSDLEDSDETASGVSSKAVMAHILNAMLSSGRISHEIAHKTLNRVLTAGYHDLAVLHKSSWEERTEVLTEGGYTRYREKTATAFGDLAALMADKYDNDATRLLPNDGGDGDPRSTLKARVGEIKQIGNVGAEIFVASVQGICPAVAPFLDSRSAKTAEELGLGGDFHVLFEALGEDAMEMARLNAALTTVRLEKREREFVG
jgi:hypothetical protein